jgi:hypothetical protein
MPCNNASMQTQRTQIALFLALLTCCGTIAWAQFYREIQSMKWMTADTGWASNDRHVFWTTDAGKHWKDIGPRIKPGQNIDAVFFLDTSIGLDIAYRRGPRGR